jgi:peptidoglycan hydrolase-like protein with peptidoglycan-binding domain
MTPLRLRLLFVAFAALATAISFNALYRQEAQRLAGSAIAVPAEEPEQLARSATASLPKNDRIASEREESEQRLSARSPAPTETAEHTEAPPAAPRLVQAVQRELTRRGYDPGPVNGNLGLETRSAIIAYEFDEGMPLRGEPTEAILKSLIFGAVDANAAPGPPVRFERHSALVAEVQYVLAAMGYSSGPIDGRLDERTRKAIRKFESDRGLEARGRLTARLLLEMVIMTGRPLNTREGPSGTG